MSGQNGDVANPTEVMARGGDTGAGANGGIGGDLHSGNRSDLGNRSDAVGRLYTQTKMAAALLESLHDIIGDDCKLALSTVEGETELLETITAAASRTMELDNMLEALNGLIGSMDARRKRLETQRERIREAIVVAMEVAGQTKIELPHITLSIRRTPPKVEVIDESAIPADFWKPQDPKLDKKALLAAMRDGQQIAGAVLSNGGATINMKVS